MQGLPRQNASISRQSKTCAACLRHLNPILANIRGGKLESRATCGGVDTADAQATQKRSVFRRISSSKGIERIEVLRGAQGLSTFPMRAVTQIFSPGRVKRGRPAILLRKQSTSALDNLMEINLSATMSQRPVY